MTQREEFENKITAIDELFGITRNLKHDVDTDNYFDASTNSAYMWFKHGWKSAKATSFTIPDRMDYELHGDNVIDSHHNTFADGYNQALSDVIAMNEEYANSTVSDGWISLSDHFPQKDGYYLCFRPLANEPPVYDECISIKRWNGGYFSGLHKVTHWMPIPPAPEQPE